MGELLSSLSSMGNSAMNGLQSAGQWLGNRLEPPSASTAGFDANQIPWQAGGPPGVPLRDPSIYSTMPWGEKIGALLTGDANLPDMPGAHDAYMQNLVMMLMQNPVFQGRPVQGAGNTIAQAFMPFLMAKMMTPATLKALQQESQDRELRKLMMQSQLEGAKSKNAYYDRKALLEAAKLGIENKKADADSRRVEALVKKYEAEAKKAGIVNPDFTTVTDADNALYLLDKNSGKLVRTGIRGKGKAERAAIFRGMDASGNLVVGDYNSGTTKTFQGVKPIQNMNADAALLQQIMNPDTGVPVNPAANVPGSAPDYVFDPKAGRLMPTR